MPRKTNNTDTLVRRSCTLLLKDGSCNLHDTRGRHSCGTPFENSWETLLRERTLTIHSSHLGHCSVTLSWDNSVPLWYILATLWRLWKKSTAGHCGTLFQNHFGSQVLQHFHVWHITSTAISKSKSRRTLRKPHTQYMGTLRQAFGKKVSFRCIWIHLILVFLEDSVALLCPAFASPGQITAWQSLPKHGKAKVEAIGWVHCTTICQQIFQSRLNKLNWTLQLVLCLPPHWPSNLCFS